MEVLAEWMDIWSEFEFLFFAGDKMKFQQWNAAFTSCVDKTSLGPQFKMLRLESCLRGEAANTVRGLGYSQEAYNAARARLERKYGGSRRQVQSPLEELKKLKPLQEENAKELEIFADVLERAVICLKENGRQADLEAGTLYTIVLEKIPDKLLSQYYRWLREKQKEESMETLNDWISQEAEYQIQASEIKHGFRKIRAERVDGNGSGSGRGGQTFYGKPVDGGDKRVKKCHVCTEIHPIWKCTKYRDQSIEDKWKMAKKLGLCYRCLGDNHLGNACKWNRQCNIDGCNDTHHYLLHRPRDSSKAPSKEKDVNMKVESGPGSNTEGDDQRKTYGATRGQETEYVALRTVPVIVKNGNKRIPVNCLLDEGSDTSYINEDVIEALGLHGAKTEINVKVANDETVTFMSSTFDVGLESTDGRVDTTITVQSSKKICGGMKPVNWIKIKHNWQHLQKIYLPKLVTGRRVDILLGADHHELMYSMKEVVGEHGQPSARLCPLGWTAVGKVNGTESKGSHHTGFHHTYFLNQDKPSIEVHQTDRNLDEMLKWFWDLENNGITHKESPTLEMTPDEKLAWTKVSESVKFNGQHYEVAVPWRDGRLKLAPNSSLAKQRLDSTERKLLKDPELAAAYQGVSNKYLEKGYIRQVPSDEPKPECEWLLPHFPVVRPDKSTTKVRIVFDALATCKGKSLNTESLPGPKLQSDIVDILVKFRKDPVALVGDISQMYHQLVLLPEDRPLHRFLWRNLDRSKEPEVYEFIHFIFGGCYCPF